MGLSSTPRRGRTTRANAVSAHREFRGRSGEGRAEAAAGRAWRRPRQNRRPLRRPAPRRCRQRLESTPGWRRRLIRPCSARNDSAHADRNAALAIRRLVALVLRRREESHCRRRRRQPNKNPRTRPAPCAARRTPTAAAPAAASSPPVQTRQLQIVVGAASRRDCTSGRCTSRTANDAQHNALGVDTERGARLNVV